jgi:hypothetical protein
LLILFFFVVAVRPFRFTPALVLGPLCNPFQYSWQLRQALYAWIFQHTHHTFVFEYFPRDTTVQHRRVNWAQQGVDSTTMIPSPKEFWNEEINQSRRLEWMMHLLEVPEQHPLRLFAQNHLTNKEPSVVPDAAETAFGCLLLMWLIIRQESECKSEWNPQPRHVVALSATIALLLTTDLDNFSSEADIIVDGSDVSDAIRLSSLVHNAAFNLQITSNFTNCTRFCPSPQVIHNGSLLQRLLRNVRNCMEKRKIQGSDLSLEEILRVPCGDQLSQLFKKFILVTTWQSGK